MGEDTSTTSQNPTMDKDISSAWSDPRFMFKVTIDLQDSLHAFVRYSRLGLFKEAEELYLEISQGNETCFAIIAERADSLLAQGRYRDLSGFLDDKINQPKKYPFEKDEIKTLLLLKGVVAIHTNGRLREALEEATSWRDASTSITPDELSTLETHSLRVYLHIITLAYVNATFVEPQYTQPPWIAHTRSQEPQKQLWSGFIDLCEQFCKNPIDFWDAQALFRLLLPVLPHDQAANLFVVLDSNINTPSNSTEEGLVSGLSITTAYVRHLIASGERADQVGKLIDVAQRMLDTFEGLVDVDNEFNDTRTRQFLEFNLALVEEESSVAEDGVFYGMFPSHNSVRTHIIWRISDRNGDLPVQAAFLHIPYLGLRGTNLNRLSDGGLPKHLAGLMGDSMGYLNAMTDRILSVYKLSIMPYPLETPPTARSARVHTGIVYQFMRDSARLDGAEASGFEYFRNLLSSFNVPFIKFKGSFAAKEPTDTRSKAPEEVLAAPPEVVTNLQGVSKDVSETPWPMHYGAEKGYRAMVKNLLEMNVDANATDINGRTPLFIVAKNGNVEIAKLLLDNKADVEAIDDELQTPLIFSVKNEDINMATLLLCNKADANARDGNSQTTLIIAIQGGNEAMVKLLLDNRADVEARGANGETPLIVAIQSDNESMVKLLLDNKAGVESKGANGETPLIVAIRSDNESMVDLLLNNEADTEAKGANDETPLIIAIQSDNTSMVKLLLKSKANIEAKGASDQTPLITAIKSQKTEMVKLLLDNNANIEAKGYDQRTPLITAVYRRKMEMVTLLLQRKADASAKDHIDRTPLIIAVMNKDQDIVTALLEGHDEAIPKDSERRLRIEASKVRGGIESLVKNALDSRARLG